MAGHVAAFPTSSTREHYQKLQEQRTMTQLMSPEPLLQITSVSAMHRFSLAKLRQLRMSIFVFFQFFLVFNQIKSSFTTFVLTFIPSLFTY